MERRLSRILPLPLQMPQVSSDAPGFAPLPRQTSQAAVLLMSIRRSVPKTASWKESSTSIEISLPRRALSRAPRSSSRKNSAVGIVLGAFFIIGKNRVGLVGLLEFLFVAVLLVGMIFVRQIPERFFYFLLRGGFIHSEDIVVILAHDYCN